MALKQEALQHLFIAIAGTDCRELWNLLNLFFGKGSDHDPFEFLDVAPAIKKPLDLVDTDSDDKASVADSSASTVTTALDPLADSPITPKPATPSSGASSFKLPAKPTWTNLHASIELAEGFVPQSAGLLHHTGIPEGISCKRSDTQDGEGCQPLHMPPSQFWCHPLHWRSPRLRITLVSCPLWHLPLVPVLSQQNILPHEWVEGSHEQ